MHYKGKFSNLRDRLKNINKNDIKKWAPWAVAIVVAILLAMLPTLAKNKENEDSNYTIESAKAEIRDIDTVLVGGGQLESSGVYDIEIPESVKIKKYMVGNGDAVKKGDPIAVVDPVTVMSAISDTQDKLKELEEDLYTYSTMSKSSTITSTPAGTVKAVYASVGDSVEDVMLEHGCLAIISLDDTMAVDIETDEKFSPGDRVNVKVGDETVNGKVKTDLSGVVTITIEDDDYAIDQMVQVYDSDNKLIGTGTLYVYSAWQANGYTGYITGVYVKVNNDISEGQSLFTVEDSENSAEYKKAFDDRQKYEDLMADLFSMYSSGYVVSPCDGIVSGVDTDGEYMLAFNGDEAEYRVVTLAQTSLDYYVSLLASESVTTSATLTSSETDVNITNLADACLKDSGLTGGTSSKWAIAYQPSGASFTVNDNDNGTLTGTGESGKTYLMGITCNYNTSTDEYNVSIIVQLSINNGGQGGSTTGGGGGGGMSGLTTVTDEDEDSDFDTYTIASVTSQEEMILTISIDELDISKVYIGQKAMITMDSFAEEPVEAVVTNISTSGENSGGNSKYEVKLQLSKSSDMLPGMNATSTITLDTTTDALCVPAAAVYEEDGQTVVYTGASEKNETLKKPVTVEVGAANADYVQILSGIDEGTTVYYGVYKSTGSV